MTVQKSLLDNYLKKYGRPTLKEISLMTGINATRVFRVLNGAKLKLDEYLIFKNLVNDLSAEKMEEDFLNLIQGLHDQQMKKEIFQFAERVVRKEKLKFNQFKSNIKKGA